MFPTTFFVVKVPWPFQENHVTFCFKQKCNITRACSRWSFNFPEKEPRGELWRGQRRGDPGEQALRGRPGRLGPVHAQGLPHRQTHPVLVLCHPASSRPPSGGGVLERLPLHTDPVR